MRLGMKLVGREDVSRRIRRMHDAVGSRALVTAGEAAAQPLVNAWKENIQAYPVILTGTYLRSVHHEVGDVDRDQVEILVGTDIVDPPYPLFLEFGTRYMSARPTARPAYDESQDEMAAEFVEAMRRLVANAA